MSKTEIKVERSKSKELDGKQNGHVVVGIDIGSLGAKGVLIANHSVYTALARTGLYMQDTADDLIDALTTAASVEKKKVQYVVATGYGRIALKFGDTPSKIITEISCHARGAHYLLPNTRTIIDMGGQDCKAIRVEDDGNVGDFAMNDKCAAGTGRFLEVMANVFKVRLDELGPLSLSATSLVPVSSTCTVFAESETISLLARGESPANILKGVHYAIAHRVAGLFSRVGVQDDVYFSGGVAKNSGMRAALEEQLKARTRTSDFDPQLVGALGAAAYAADFAN